MTRTGASLLALVLAGCGNVHRAPDRCEAVETYYLGEPDNSAPIAGDCNLVWKFDAPWGRKFPGEK